MKNKQKNNRKRLHLVALILGAYVACLGFGLVLAGLNNVGEAIGTIRILLGLGMMGFGIYGIWDGIQDKVRPQAKSELKAPTQYILTDTSGNRTSNVTVDKICEELKKLQAGEQDSFHLQVLTQFDIPRWGALKQISCTKQSSLTLLAFFQTPEGDWKLCSQTKDPETAVDWFRQLLEDSLEFSGWADSWELLEEVPEGTQKATDSKNQEFRARVLRDQAGVYTVWHRQLIIVGNAWRNEHRFFTARDVELAAQGVFEGKYQYATLEWGSSSFDVIPGLEDQLQVIWCTNIRDDTVRRFFRKEGTVTQVKFWLIQYLNEGTMNEFWDEIAAPTEKKGRKNNG